jgi:hypothetical protein
MPVLLLNSASTPRGVGVEGVAKQRMDAAGGVEWPRVLRRAHDAAGGGVALGVALKRDAAAVLE